MTVIRPGDIRRTHQKMYIEFITYIRNSDICHVRLYDPDYRNNKTINDKTLQNAVRPSGRNNLRVYARVRGNKAIILDFEYFEPITD